jgi:hypothetical protein
LVLISIGGGVQLSRDLKLNTFKNFFTYLTFVVLGLTALIGAFQYLTSFILEIIITGRRGVTHQALLVFWNDLGEL